MKRFANRPRPPALCLLLHPPSAGVMGAVMMAANCTNDHCLLSGPRFKVHASTCAESGLHTCSGAAVRLPVSLPPVNI